MNHSIAAAGLIALGCMQMAGDLSGNREARAFGLATHASPAPKVFTSQEGFETFSSHFFIDWIDGAGEKHALEITPRTYAGVKGPYNRRNAYGAALSYAPVLQASENTRPMLQSVMRYAFCGRAPLVQELAIPREHIRSPLQIRLEPRATGGATANWQTRFQLHCERRQS
jgi:hypothetical protein